MINKKHKEPFLHYIVDNFLPNNLHNMLANINFKREFGVQDGVQNAVTRFFITEEQVNQLPFLKDVVNYTNISTNIFEKFFDYSLRKCFMRFELVYDNSNYWQEPHLDTLEKLLTILVYLDGVGDLGTDLFDKNINFFNRVDWKLNRALIFKPDKSNWHAFKKRDFDGLRKVLIINYVDKNKWNSREQVWDVDL